MKDVKEKDKQTTCKLLFNIEAWIDLEELLKDYVLNTKVEFTLKINLEILKEFYN